MAEPTEVQRVSTLELFFDLVFVFTITQIARLVSTSHTVRDFASASLILMIVWWMYAGYAWLTSNVGTELALRRLLMLSGMAAYFIMALSIPHATTDDALPFGLAFMFVGIVHAIMFTKATNSSAAAIFRIMPFNFSAAGCVIAAAFLPVNYRWVGWLAAVLIFFGATFFGRERGFRLSPGHFAERHGLVIIVAIGESVVSLGTGIETNSVRWPLIRVVLLGFALCAAIWWTYFDRDDARAEHAFRAVPAERQARVGLIAYSYAHLGMVAGIVGIAAGLHETIARLGGPVPPNHALMLSCGVALYLLSDKWFRTVLGIGPSHYRGGAGVLALVAAPFGSRISSAMEVALLAGLLVAVLVAEAKEHYSSQGRPLR